MEFNFIKKERENASIDLLYINNIEAEFNIKFPEILKQYYLLHNGAIIKKCIFERKGLKWHIVSIYGFKYTTLPLENLLKLKKNYKLLPTSLVPFALDETEGEFYWDAQDGKVYYSCKGWHPLEICDSVEEFFEILNACCNQLQDEASMEERKLEESEILVTEKSKRKGFLFWK